MKLDKNRININISFGWITLTEKTLFTKNLALMLKSGLSLSEALEIISGQTEGKLKSIVEGLAESVKSGNTLSVSLKTYGRVFSKLYINTIAAGESSGNLENNLEVMAVQLKKDKELISKVRGAMIYPVMVMTVALAIGSFIAFFILPKITPMFLGLKVKLPLSTRILIKLSYFVEHYGLIAAAVFVLLAILAAIILRRNFIKPTTHYINLHLPLFSRLIKNMNLIIFSRTLSTLFKSGMNIDEALNLTSDTVSNYYYSRSLKNASENIVGGTKLSENLMRYGNLYPKIATNMIMVGEKAGTLEESLLYLEEYYQSEVDEAIKSLTSVIEPALLIFIGFAIGGLAISIITPIYMLTSNIR